MNNGTRWALTSAAAKESPARGAIAPFGWQRQGVPRFAPFGVDELAPGKDDGSFEESDFQRRRDFAGGPV